MENAISSISTDLALHLVVLNYNDANRGHGHLSHRSGSQTRWSYKAYEAGG
jgi:hypothetical protein